MYGDGLRTCAPVKSIKTSQQVFIGFKNLPTGYYQKLKTSGQSMPSNGRLAIETSIKNLNWYKPPVCKSTWLVALKQSFIDFAVGVVSRSTAVVCLYFLSFELQAQFSEAEDRD